MSQNMVGVPDLEVHMLRQDMEDIPVFALPSGYQIRLFQEGDEETWLRIQRAAEKILTIEDELFERAFGEHPGDLRDRMFFLQTAEGEDVGTASAWWEADWRSDGDWGQVHWVAIHPAHQGRGLTKPLLSKVMQRLAESHHRAMLGTSTARIWAIKVYLDYGFRPDANELANEEIVQAWQAVNALLKHPSLTRV